MIDKKAHRLLGLFGDAQQHQMFEIVKFGAILLKKHERKVEEFFKQKLHDKGWFKLMWNIL